MSPPRLTAVVVCPLLLSIRRSTRRVAGFVAVAIEERSGENHSSSYSVVAARHRPRPAVAASATTRRCCPLSSPLLRTSIISSCHGLVPVSIEEAADEAPWAEEEVGRSSANGVTGLRIE